MLRLENTEGVTDPLRNTVTVVGSGQRCLPGDRNQCGDGGMARHARLTYPKGEGVKGARSEGKETRRKRGFLG